MQVTQEYMYNIYIDRTRGKAIIGMAPQAIKKRRYIEKKVSPYLLCDDYVSIVADGT